MWEFVTDPTSLLYTSRLMADVDQARHRDLPLPVLEFEGWAASLPEPAPVVGEHTDDVLAALLGKDAAELEELRDRGLIGGRSHS